MRDRKFFGGQQNGSKPAPQQSKLKFSTRTKKEAEVKAEESDEDYVKVERDVPMEDGPDAEAKAGAVKAEEDEEEADEVKSGQYIFLFGGACARS